MIAPDHDVDCGMVLVMGVTGSGKSYFINKLVEGSVAEGAGLRSGKNDFNHFTAIADL